MNSNASQFVPNRRFVRPYSAFLINSFTQISRIFHPFSFLLALPRSLSLSRLRVRTERVVSFLPRRFKTLKKEDTERRASVTPLCLPSVSRYFPRSRERGINCQCVIAARSVAHTRRTHDTRNTRTHQQIRTRTHVPQCSAGVGAVCLFAIVIRFLPALEKR